MIKDKFCSRRTFEDADYPSCEYTFAQLLIYTNTDTQQITHTLGIAPTYAQNKGDVLVNSRGVKREAKLSYWNYSSEKKVQSKDLRHHLNWLLEQLKDRKNAIETLQNESGISMSVDCIWTPKSSAGGGPVIWPEQMSVLSNLNLELAFDCYYLG